MYNSVTLVGRMVNDAEIFVSSNDVKVARFRFAVDLPKSRQTESKSADFFKCTAFKGAAECIERYTQIYSQGSKASDTWQTEQQFLHQQRGTENQLYGNNRSRNRVARYEKY